MEKTDQPLHDVCLAIGSNLGDSLETLRATCAALEPYMTITHKSGIYETKAAYVADQPDFLNAAIRGLTPLDPVGLLYTVKDIEIDLGRRPTFRYGPRVIDIDIVFYDNLLLRSTELSIPHILMAERDFVLRPLADIAPEWRHPALNKTVLELLTAIESQDTTRLISDKL